MSKVQRGGLTLKTGKIGRVNCLRQQMMMPGERMNISLNGKVRLESLRERDVMRINAHLGVFMTPMRWLWSQYPDYIKEGNDGIFAPPVASSQDWARVGIGSNVILGQDDYYKWYDDAYLRVYNEWYKWPENADSTTINADGEIAVPLSKAWTRCRYNATPLDQLDYSVSEYTPGLIDVREIAEKQARFRDAMKRDVLTYNRWMELINDTYKGDGSREVDQIPIMIDQVEVGVNPREIPATDAAGLGQWQSLFDFQVDHQIRGVTAPEHCILTYMLTVRFAAVTESMNPLANSSNNWFTLSANPEYLSSARPQVVQANDLFQTNDTTEMGYLPAGWQWRCDSDVIGARIDARNSFPLMITPTTQAEAKDATRITDAFRSQALGDYVTDVFISEDSTQPIGTSMDSYMSGMVEHQQPGSSNSNDEFPKGGKML